MIRLDMPQGSPEWIAARCGIPTASQFHRILTAKTHKPSSAADDYINELIAESLLGASLDPYVSELMERGIEMQDQAHSYYEFQRDCTADLVGHCLTDDRRAGCSPDALVGDSGGLEIKCPTAKVHVSYMRGTPDKYTMQVQGALWITGRKWWDFLSFHPELPPVLRRWTRKEEIIGKLYEAVTNFCKRLDDETQKIAA